MNDLETKTRALRALRDDDGPGLDPGTLMAGAKRRRARGVAATAVASVAVASVAVGGFLAAAGDEGEPQVAGPAGPVATPSVQPSVQPLASASASSGLPSGPETLPRTASSQPIPKARTSWTPGGPIGAKPVGTVPIRGKVAIAAKYWFETRGTQWCITAYDATTGGTFEPLGCRGTVGNTNLGDDRVPGIQSSIDAAGNKVVTSVFRGAPRRVIYTDGDRYYEAKLYRLAGIPGWTMAVATYQPVGSRLPADAYVFAYDDAGRVTAQFPAADQGGPATDPLR
ncbi:hypothetical protein FB561_3674 [Kribbella amoyensis]|uniref:Uncharacterized protein n=1 Tax=Kribbella amoyensis TaxID=996641 RepID=A0A561BUQ7_9ACTN|nr:hypothetical protein [Kribbella amoyensis]TWD82541.1 hypothetical protein FB561_3674 [Kribbella amoyensis]